MLDLVSRHPPLHLRRLLTIAATALLVALAVMTIVPPLDMPMLILVVGATELSPMLAVAALLWLPLALLLLRGARRLQLGVGMALLLAGTLSLRPLARFTETARRAAEQLGGAPREFSLGDMLRGAPDAEGVTERVVPYTAADGSPLAMRLFRAPPSRALPGARPTVVVMYGGAWRGGDPTQGAAVSRALAARGYLVAAIDYRHAPRDRFPAQLADVRRSIALLRDSSASWGIDRSRIALLGRSAGGHLAELAAFTADTPAVRAVVAIYAPFDLEGAYREPPVPDPIGVRVVLRDFLGGTPAEQPRRYRDASPASFVRPGLPPVLLLYGARDHIVRATFNRRAADALRAAGGRVVQLEVPWAEHGFDLAPGGLGRQLAFDAIVRFLARELAAR